MSNYADEAAKLGYTVGVAQEGYEHPDGDARPTVYRIEGFGVSIMLPENDHESWERFLNKTVHEHRVNFARHMDPEDKFEMSEEDIMKSSFKAQVALGDLKQKEADEQYAAWEEARASA